MKRSHVRNPGVGRGNPGVSRKPCQLWKITIRYLLADDICNACYFIWGYDVDHALGVLDNVIHWPPFEVIESELLEIHKPLNIKQSVEQQLGLDTMIGRKGYREPKENSGLQEHHLLVPTGFKSRGAVK